MGRLKTIAETMGINQPSLAQMELDAMAQRYKESIEKEPNLIVSAKYVKTLLRLNKRELGELFHGLIHTLYNGEEVEETEENKGVLVLMSLIIDETEDNFDRYKSKATNGYISSLKRKKRELGL